MTCDFEEGLIKVINQINNNNNKAVENKFNQYINKLIK